MLVQVFITIISFVDVHLNWLSWSHFCFLVGGPLIIRIDCMIFLLFYLEVMKISKSKVFFHIVIILTSLPRERCPLAYNLSSFNSKDNTFGLWFFSNLLSYRLFIYFFCATFFCNFMPCGGCWAWCAVNPNLSFKKKVLANFIMFSWWYFHRHRFINK